MASEKLTRNAERQIRRLAETTTLEEAIPLIQCGLEFEYHGMDGGAVNRTRLQEASYAAWDRLTRAQVIATMPSPLRELMAEIHGRGKDPSMSSVMVTIDREHGRDTFWTHAETYNTRMNTWRAEWETAELERNRSAYTQGRVNAQDVRGFEGLNHAVEFGSDGSVRGGEIRTLGPQDIPTFLRVSEALSKNPFHVDEGCSFHIHLSVPEVNHSYGVRFQAEMYAFLISKFDEMPESVQKRIHKRDGGAGQWAKFVLENESKYCAIYRHPQRTWEFRLFGNVTKFDEMQKCLELAVGALRHAYRVKCGLTESLVGPPSMGRQFIQQCLDLAVQKRKPKLFLEELRKYDPPTAAIEAGAA